MSSLSKDYFFNTPAKNWKMSDAMVYYDKLYSYESIYDLLVDLLVVLNCVETIQPSFKKHVSSMTDEIKLLLNLNIYTRNLTDNNQENVAPTSQNASTSTESIQNEKQRGPSIEKLTDVLNNHGQINVQSNKCKLISNTSLGKRCAEDMKDEPVLANSFSGRYAKPECKIDEGSNQYHMASPAAHFEHPHKPKLRRLQIDNLKELFHFGTSFSKSHSSTAALYYDFEEEQKTNKSLQSLNVLDLAVSFLEDLSYANFNKELWTNNIENPTKISDAFLEILRYTLCSFHLTCKTIPEFSNNHERTYFIENIIPSLLALAKNTGFIEFKWCETEFHSTKVLDLREYDYDLRKAPPSKNIDALGILTTQNNMELIVVESSSGKIKEHTTHTIEDSLKILECGVAALKKEAVNYKNASLETFNKLKVFSIHVIKTQVTLSEMSLFDAKHWKFIERRSAKLPTNWNDRLGMIQYLELLATLFEGVLYTQTVQNDLVRENLGLSKFSGPSVGSISEASASFNSNILSPTTT